MKTRGLLIWRFGGRYYSLYHPHSSYPGGLGLDLLDTIPQEKEDYQAWLRERRADLANWNAILDSKVLCIGDGDIERLRTKFVHSDGYPVWDQQSELRCHILDDRLEVIPSWFAEYPAWAEWVSKLHYKQNPTLLMEKLTPTDRYSYLT